MATMRKPLSIINIFDVSDRSPQQVPLCLSTAIVFDLFATLGLILAGRSTDAHIFVTSSEAISVVSNKRCSSRCLLFALVTALPLFSVIPLSNVKLIIFIVLSRQHTIINDRISELKH